MTDLSESRSRLKKIRLAIYGAIFFLAFAFVVLGWVLPRQAMQALSESFEFWPIFLLMRLCLYGAVITKWKQIALSFNPDVSSDVVSKSRTSVVTLCIVYELLFGLNVLKLLF